jgi:hypothetical protein
LKNKDPVLVKLPPLVRRRDDRNARIQVQGLQRYRLNDVCGFGA